MKRNNLLIGCAYLGMMVFVAASNYLVQFPINAWLTWGAFPYPACFLVTELTNCFYGPKVARRVVYVGFWLGVALSAWLATFQIVLASGSAFLISQLLDIAVFNRLRRTTWWYAPLSASVLASIIDTCIFWTIAFWGEAHLTVFVWAIGDCSVKFLMDITLLLPFRLFLYGSIKKQDSLA